MGIRYNLVSEYHLMLEMREMRRQFLEALGRFLYKLPYRKRYIFIEVYMRGRTIESVAADYQISRPRASIILKQVRGEAAKELKEFRPILHGI